MTAAAKEQRKEYFRKLRENATPEQKAARAAYLKKWRLEHPATPEQKAAKAAYMKEWRKANADKVKAINERYWERRAAKAAAELEP